MGTLSSIIIVLALIYAVGFAIYLIHSRSRAKEINDHFDKKIKEQPWKANFFNALRYIELGNEEKAKEPFHQYLQDRTQEELMYMPEEKGDAEKD